MICCYLLHGGYFDKADESLHYYGVMRTLDAKGVTIPSQRRYVAYYAQLLRQPAGVRYERTPLRLCELRLTNAQSIGLTASSVHISIAYVSDSKEQCLFGAELPECKRTMTQAGQLVIQLAEYMPLAGDVRVELYHRSKMMRKRQVVVKFWFNTFFVQLAETERRQRERAANGGGAGGGGGGGGGGGCEVVDRRPTPAAVAAPAAVPAAAQPSSGKSAKASKSSNGSRSRANAAEEYVPTDYSGPEFMEFVLLKKEIDMVHKDKKNEKFPKDFRVSACTTATTTTRNTHTTLILARHRSSSRCKSHRGRTTTTATTAANLAPPTPSPRRHTAQPPPPPQSPAAQTPPATPAPTANHLPPHHHHCPANATCCSPAAAVARRPRRPHRPAPARPLPAPRPTARRPPPTTTARPPARTGTRVSQRRRA